MSEALAPLVRLGVQLERREEGPAGVEIEEVLDGGPGATAGLRRGDTIAALGGRMTTRVDQLAELLLEATDDHLSVAYVDPAGGKHLTAVRLSDF